MAEILDLQNGQNQVAQIQNYLQDGLDNLQDYIPKDAFDKNESFIEESSEMTATEKLCKKLQEGAGISIPGLNIDNILDLLANKNKSLQRAIQPLKDSIYYIKENTRISEEEKQQRIQKLKEQRKQQIQAWKDSQKDFVQKTINDIKADFGEIKFGLENMTAMVPIVISQIALPTFIGTGSPNPARIAADGMAYKKLLQGMVHPMLTSASKMLDNCSRIGFDLPTPILAIIESVMGLDKLINSIPG